MPYIIKHKINFLSEASKILSSSLDYSVTLESVANLLVTNVADFCTVDIFVGKKLQRLIVKVANPEYKKYEKRIYDFLPDPRNKDAVYDTAKYGKAIIKKVTKKWMMESSRIQEERDVVEKLGIKSVIFTPMKSRGKVIGVITIASSKQGFMYKHEDGVFMEELANRIGLAVDNARLFHEAKEALRTRDEFLSIASHELKTPLTSILLNLQLVLHKIQKTKTNTPEIDAIIKMVEVSKQQTQRMARLVSDLLNVSVVSTGRLKIEKEEMELNSLMKDIISRFSSQLKTANITLDFKKGEKIIGMWDKIRLEQVFSNLISNAIKYGEKKPINVEIKKKKDKAIIVVKDYGIGISRKNQEMIFDRFKRAVNSKDYSGLGVGLYISQQVIHAHKGKLIVESDIGKGSTFTVILPI